MKAHAIIGANFGDEGKGLMTDYICSVTGADVVVRFNGGAQAGHTVIAPEGLRNVFHHIGSGSLLGIPTFLSRFFIVNPVLFHNEGLFGTKIYVDPRALVTTPIDMLINQAEMKPHHSCGVGINETIQRSKHPRFCITVADMMQQDKWEIILREYALGKYTGRIPGFWRDVFYNYAEQFLNSVTITCQPPGENIVFEGAQGLLLDQESPYFPYVTHSYTGIRNVLDLCNDWRIKNLQATYVTRTYLTRHGAGPLFGEQPLPDWVIDETNIDNQYQGPLRYAPLDVEELEARVKTDAGHTPYNIAVTCMDQQTAPLRHFQTPPAYLSFGPTRKDVYVR